mgnify:CR=1 FL=1
MQQELQNYLDKFIENPQDGLNTFFLAKEYEQQGHTAAALSYYLRVAEYSEDKDLIYEALLRAGKCLSSQGRRKTSEKGLYLQAISVAPERPEAYFILSQYHEFYQEWLEAYTTACTGEFLKLNRKDTYTDLGYVGQYVLAFQKAVAAWWIGRAKEARESFQHISDKFFPVMTPFYQNLLQQNITSLGSGPHPFLTYTKDKHGKLLYKFPGSENIERNYAQTYQDMFVLSALKGKRNGTYLEIGAADPFKGNNTALLETDFGWKGASIEILEHEVNAFRAHRKNPVHHLDATKIDYDKFIGDLGFGNEIDYLQVDCEPPSTTFDILKMIPLNKYKFAVITFEHDYYADTTKLYRDLSREYLEEKGYILAVSNIAPDNTSSFEDWWIHPDLVDKKILKKLQNTSDQVKKADKYMLGEL